MKYFAVVIMLVLMAWTWSLATASRSFSMEQHKIVEAGVEEDIRAFINKRYPETKEIFCQQLYTEIVDPGVELIARFRCLSVAAVGTDESTEQVFQGHIRLRSKDGFRNWDEVGGEIQQPEIRFMKGTKISPKDLDGTSSDDDATAEEEK